MIAFLRLLEHREVVIELLFRFKRGAVNTLEMRVTFVAFVVGARHVRQLESANISRAHDVRPRTKIDEVAIAIERDFFVGRNVLEMSIFNLLVSGRSPSPASRPFSPSCQSFVARNFNPLERMVRLDLLLHLRLDFLEIVRRDAVRKFDVVIKTIFDRRPGSELRFRPDLQNRRSKDVGSRMTQTFQVRHLLAFSKVLRSSFIKAR